MRPSGSAGRARRAAVIAAAPLIVAVGVCGCGVTAPAAAPTGTVRPSASASPPATSAPPVETARPLERGEAPAAVTIPAIGLAESLIDLGINGDGTMEVPADFDDVGWFTGGGRPGGIGPTVIAGHVDSPSGPAVFVRLRELVVGSTFQVTDVAGETFDYEVYEVGQYPKADFPTSRVFGATATDEVRLITCTGVFDTSIGHYDDNRVVFASRVPA
ncbi:MAG: hypothetical protein RI885_2367 [Actinomycetota bacterium]